MFGGLIETRGRLILRQGGRLWVSAPPSVVGRLARGGSLAVNGVCLSVASKGAGRLSFDVSPETLRRTTLGRLRTGEIVHLEQPLRYGQRIGGHFVLGHVEGIGRIVCVKPEGRCRSFQIACPPALSKWVLPKGSIALDGVSLTCGKRSGRRFWVHCIPATLSRTGLGGWKIGTRVNIETDYLLKSPTPPRGVRRATRSTRSAKR